MDQTNNIVGLFKNMQNNGGGRGGGQRHEKSPEMTFLKRAAKITGSGPWGVSKGKRAVIRTLIEGSDEFNQDNDHESNDYDYESMQRNSVNPLKRDDTESENNHQDVQESSYEGKASIPNDYLDMEHEQMNQKFNQETEAVSHLFDSVLQRGANNGRYVI